MKIEALFKQPNALPSAPKIVQELIASFSDELISTEEISRKLATDPVLSAKLLRLANSAYYNVSRTVSSVNDAVTMLGFVTVRTLVISSGLVNGFKSASGLDLKQFWRYSLNTAVSAKWLAQHLNENSDLVFTVGMMHAIGQLVIRVGMPEEAQLLDKEVAPLDRRRLDAERAAMGFNYAEVGAELAVRWKFPNAFPAIIRTFPNPLEQQPFNPMSAIVYLAAWLSWANENHLTRDELLTHFPADIGGLLGIDPVRLFDDMPALSELSQGLEALIA